jgi:hypothetical protein
MVVTKMRDSSRSMKSPRASPFQGPESGGAFTLIELLVVLAVIVNLVYLRNGLLWPYNNALGVYLCPAEPLGVCR